MAVLAPHNLVTWRGQLGSNEIWQFGIRWKDALGVANSTATANALAQSWKDKLGPWTAGYVRLSEVRISPIGSDGKLAAEPTISTIAPLAGGMGSKLHPYQVSLAVSLRSNRVSGKLSHGRFYLPGPAVNLVSTGAVDPDEMTAVRAGVGAFLHTCVSTMATPAGGTESPILVSRGSQDYEPVTRWAVGEVLDTIRSRRGGLIETRAYAAIP